jgi:hypothetical protein
MDRPCRDRAASRIDRESDRGAKRPCSLGDRQRRHEAVPSNCRRHDFRCSSAIQSRSIAPLFIPRIIRGSPSMSAGRIRELPKSVLRRRGEDEGIKRADQLDALTDIAG